MSFMSTRKWLIVPSSASSTFCSEIHAPLMPLMDCWAFAMPLRIASSNDPGEVAVISITFATDTWALLSSDDLGTQRTRGGSSLAAGEALGVFDFLWQSNTCSISMAVQRIDPLDEDGRTSVWSYPCSE